MVFDPRSVAFEGRLHADRHTAEYVGRANNEADAACFRSRRAAGVPARSRAFYFETQVVATNPELASSLLPSRINTPHSSTAIRRHAAQDRDAAATSTRGWRRSAELEAMDMEDVQLPAPNGGTSGVPVNFNFSLNSRTMQHMRARLDRRRLRRSSEKKRFSHKVAVGFLLDEAAQKSTASGGITRGFTGFSGFLEARRTVKQLMQRVLPDTTADGASESSEEGERKPVKTYPSILHRDLGETVNSLAYVGKTGCVISHGREFLQCERYGAGDVVGCGVLLDTNTFFFTLNGKLMGLLAARDVYDLDDFKGVEKVDESGSDEDTESDEEGATNGTKSEEGVKILLDRIEDVEMEDTDGRYEEEKALYPAVSLHGAGECVKGVFEPQEFVFDLAGFEQQLQKERQRALLAEREKRSASGPVDAVEQADCEDEAAMNELMQDFFLHYGYESAYQAFEATQAASTHQESSNGVELSCDRADTTAVPLNLKEESKNEEMHWAETPLNAKKQEMLDSLSVRHQVCDHIRGFRTAQALVVLEQHVPALLNNWSSYRSRRLRKLILYCRILCVIDVLTNEGETKPAAVSTNGSTTSSTEELECNGWNPELAIEFARQVFASTEISNGKRKRTDSSNGTHKLHESTDDVALAMSLLLYDRRENVPSTSGAIKFLTPAFRESVADQLNSLLLTSDDSTKSQARVSALETFMNELEHLQKECLRQGCRVYPDSVENTSNGQHKTSRRRRASVYSSSDDSSSQSEQEDRLEDEEEDE
ncbi:SPRY domain-containing protein [Phytophthora infestans]|uniref:SPRY domain-containing protein n=1 Tax=Phytophthora infestans TaxID=4787 RepID=A0A8S9U7M0_PHYIN|nr:SPRY domain-containing protein [Phytophthora infestans]